MKFIYHNYIVQLDPFQFSFIHELFQEFPLPLFIETENWSTVLSKRIFKLTKVNLDITALTQWSGKLCRSDRMTKNLQVESLIIDKEIILNKTLWSSNWWQPPRRQIRWEGVGLCRIQTGGSRALTTLHRWSQLWWWYIQR